VGQNADGGGDHRRGADAMHRSENDQLGSALGERAAEGRRDGPSDAEEPDEFAAVEVGQPTEEQKKAARGEGEDRDHPCDFVRRYLKLACDGGDGQRTGACGAHLVRRKRKKKRKEKKRKNRQRCCIVHVWVMWTCIEDLGASAGSHNC